MKTITNLSQIFIGDLGRTTRMCQKKSIKQLLNNKVKEMGLCADTCNYSETGINFATLNLLTQDECVFMYSQSAIKVGSFSSTLNKLLFSNP